MINQLETKLFGYSFLEFFKFFVLKFDNIPCFKINKVMVMFLVHFETGKTFLEFVFNNDVHLI